MTDLRDGIAAAEARITRLRASNDAARLRLSPEGRRDDARAWVLWLATGALVTGFAGGHVTENDRRHEHGRIEAVLHRERMYSKHYEGETCGDRRHEVAQQMLRCTDELER